MSICAGDRISSFSVGPFRISTEDFVCAYKYCGTIIIIIIIIKANNNNNKIRRSSTLIKSTTTPSHEYKTFNFITIETYLPNFNFM